VNGSIYTVREMPPNETKASDRDRGGSVENMEDILATLSVETRRVAVRSTARLDECIGVTLA
jgi:hypothetical protein